MNIKKLFYILALIFTLNSTTALAVQMPNIYSATVPVASRSSDQLSKSLQTALGQVLVKISGNPGIITLPKLKSALNQANQLVKTYSYLENQNTDTNEAPLQLHVTFDKQGILQLLHQNHQAIWSHNRPLTLIWINNTTTQSNLESLSEINQTIKKEASFRGLPIIFPTMDPHDLNLMNNLKQSNRFDPSKLSTIASRYRADAILSGQISFSNADNWQIQWRLLFNEQPLEWVTTGEQINVALTSGVNQAANLIASQQTILDNKDLQTTINIEVTNINNLTEYAQLSSYLHSINIVSSVAIGGMNGSNVLVSLQVSGQTEDLQNQLATNKHLKQITQAIYTDSDKINLAYQWVSQMNANKPQQLINNAVGTK